MPANRENTTQNIMPPHYLHELPAQEEERLENMFKKLDLDGNGRIDVHDLSNALREVGLDKKYAKKFLARSDKTNSGDITLAEFIHYIREHEKHLKLQFSHVDKNKDGKIDLEELITAFEELGINIGHKKAMKLLQRMDKDGSLNISFNEWRDFLIYAPSTELSSIIEYWNHAVFMDSGDEISVPRMISGFFGQHLIAGAIAGVVSRTITAPLDRVKVFLQVHGKESIKGILDCTVYIYKEGGIISFWRGNSVNLIKVSPETGIKFAAYEKVKKIIKGSDTRELAISERFLAGSVAGGVSQSVIYPFEVLKTRLVLGKTGEFTTMRTAARRMYAQGGVKVFYRGYVPNLIGIIPYAGIDLAVYETLKNSYLKMHNKTKKPTVWIILCGIASSSAGQVCTYPLALVRTRLQAQIPPNRSTSMRSVLCDIVKTEGIRGLYRGLLPNFIKVAPAVCVSYLVYEYLTAALGVDMT